MSERINYSIECLKLVTDEFDKNEIPYWLDWGTLLGAYRNSTIIGYDYDMDVGIESTYANKVKFLFEKMISDGKFQKLPLAKWFDDKIYQIQFNKNKQIDPMWLDIYFYKKKDNFIYSSFFSTNETLKCRANLYQIQNLETIQLGNYYFKCPNDVPKFLKIRYGENFMTPQSRCYSLNKEWWEVDDNVGNQYLD